MHVKLEGKISLKMRVLSIVNVMFERTVFVSSHTCDQAGNLWIDMNAELQSMTLQL
jgi:hypothetical protein